VGVPGQAADIDANGLPKVYHSYSLDSKRPSIPAVPGTVHVPTISGLTTTGIVLDDGTFLVTRGPTTILLATGYELAVPFLSLLEVDKNLAIPAKLSNPRVATNLTLIRPLYRQIFAIDERLPRNVLAFIGLPVPIANGPSSYAQGLFAAHGIADVGSLPSKEEMLSDLEANESEQRLEGHEPLEVGQ
jgi:hypothetical protein